MYPGSHWNTTWSPGSLLSPPRVPFVGMPGSLQEVAVETVGAGCSTVMNNIFSSIMNNSISCSKRPQINLWELSFYLSYTLNPIFMLQFLYITPPYLQSSSHSSSSPENCRAKPCLLVKKSVVNCRLMVLKVLWASGGSTEPLSSLSRTPPSWGPSQIRSTSCTSSVWKTRKCRLLKKRWLRRHYNRKSGSSINTLRLHPSVCISVLQTATQCKEGPLRMVLYGT